MSPLTREQLLDDLQAFAAELGTVPTRTQMNDEGPHSQTPYYRVFGSWNEALRAAGLTLNHSNNVSEQELIEALQELSENLGHVPLYEEMSEYGRFDPATYLSHFGSWPKAKEAAGLDPTTQTARRTLKGDLLEAVRGLAEKLGKAPTQTEMNEFGRYSHRPFYREFGSWREALIAAGLDPNHDRGIRDEVLIKEVQFIAEKLGRTPTIEDLSNQGRYSLWPYLRAFNSWNEALQEAGFSPNHEWGVAEGPINYGPNWPEQRQKTLKRDGHQCQECGMSNQQHKKEYGVSLHVHHLKKARKHTSHEKSNRLENLVALCWMCHSKLEKSTRSENNG